MPAASYDLNMQAVLYYPFINVPESAWLTRALLYWDSVGTIVPESYIGDGSTDLSPFTYDLVREGLLLQVLPQDAGHEFSSRFDNYMSALSRRDLKRRRKSFLEPGGARRIHLDKWLMYGSGLYDLKRQGLARDHSRRWIEVEAHTADEFMAALAATLCTPGMSWQQRPDHITETPQWVPITDQPESMQALMAGVQPSVLTSSPYEHRLLGHGRILDTRDALMEVLLPVPEESMSIDALLQFRMKHGSLLPRFRRYLEAQVDELNAQTDLGAGQRRIDRLAEEVDERVEQVSAYLAESGVRRVGRSSLLRWLRFIPGASTPIRNAQDLAEANLQQSHLREEPLAYLAFARKAFQPERMFPFDVHTGLPLIEAVRAHAPERA